MSVWGGAAARPTGAAGPASARLATLLLLCLLVVRILADDHAAVMREIDNEEVLRLRGWMPAFLSARYSSKSTGEPERRGSLRCFIGRGYIAGWLVWPAVALSHVGTEATGPPVEGGLSPQVPDLPRDRRGPGELARSLGWSPGWGAVWGRVRIAMAPAGSARKTP